MSALDPIYVPTAVLAAVFVCTYLIRCWLGGKTADLGAASAMVLQCSGVVSGSLMMASTVFPEIQERLANLRLYMLIGGGAVVWVSARALLSHFKK